MRSEESISKNLDWLTIFLYLLLVLYGCISIYSAVYDPLKDQSIFDFSTKAGNQLIWTMISIVVAFLIMIIDFRFYFAFSYPIYGLIVLLLIGALIFGIEVNGAKAWFQLGSVRIMPAEFSKIAVALVLARFMDETHNKFGINKPTGLVILLIIIPALIILKQNETGTVLIFSSIIVMMYREGLNPLIPVAGILVAILFITTVAFITYESELWPLYLGIGVLTILLVYLFRQRQELLIISIVTGAICFSIIYSTNYFFENILQEHQQLRLISVIEPEKDPQGAGYQTSRSKVAIGSGGFSGKGYLNGNLTQGDYVPEQHTDFIFTTLGEERGFKGTSIFIILYLGFLIRLIFIAERQKSKFARVFGYVTIGIILWHFMVNVGMTIGLFPVIGIPLPFFSYGGSSLLAFTILIFIFLKLDMHRSEILSRD